MLNLPKLHGTSSALLAALVLTSSLLRAQPGPDNGGPARPAPEAAAAESEDGETYPRPEATDAASEKLIRNYLVQSGGRDAHNALRSTVATGTVNEAGKRKSFKLVETRDGKRFLRHRWKHLGREHETIRGFDGETTWRQTLRPEKQPPETFGGVEARHFRQQRWFLHPFLPPLADAHVFQYRGKARVRGRPAHLVLAHGPGKQRSWFYFDAETFLVVRHGGLSRFAGSEDYLDYRTRRFAPVGGVLMPRKLELLAEDDAFGTIDLDSVEANRPVDPDVFRKPPDETPVLRQQSVPRSR